MHCKEKHDESVKKLYKCDTCEKSFIFPSELRKHDKIHSFPSFKCEICDNTFATKGYLKSHQKTHSTVKSYECNDCEKTYKSNDCLKDHIAKNHSGLPKKPSYYECDICNRKIRFRGNFKSHLKTHTTTGQKPY